MKSFPLPPFRHVRGLAAALLVSTVWCPAPSRADSSPPLFEIRAQFVHASPAQLYAALVAAKVDQSATILTPAQYAAMRTALQSVGAQTFCEPELVSQSGERASAENVKELRCPTKYEPSKKEAGKFVPTAFEMRPVGETLEAAPVAKADGRIQLKVTATYTRFLGFVDYLDFKPDKNNPPPPEDFLKAPLQAGGWWQPWFSTFENTRTVEVPDGSTLAMSGREAPGAVNSPPGQPQLLGHTAAPGVAVFVTVRKVIRN